MSQDETDMSEANAELKDEVHEMEGFRMASPLREYRSRAPQFVDPLSCGEDSGFGLDPSMLMQSLPGNDAANAA